MTPEQAAAVQKIREALAAVDAIKPMVNMLTREQQQDYVNEAAVAHIRYRDASNPATIRTLLAALDAAQATREVPRLTDDGIDECIPVADGSAEVNVRRVEVLPGIMGQEFEEEAAWSLPLVRQIARAVESRVRELCGVAP